MIQAITVVVPGYLPEGYDPGDHFDHYREGKRIGSMRVLEAEKPTGGQQTLKVTLLS